MGKQLAADGGRLWASRPQLHPPGWADGVGPCLRALLRGCGAGVQRDVVAPEAASVHSPLLK